MTRQTYTLELITPCFCAGADPAQAEIRAPSIRGQLRWWFRVLGGFKSLATMPVPDQEAMIFGQTAGDDGCAGKLMVRISSPQPRSERKNADDLGGGTNTPLGYALFPLRPFGESDGRRGVMAEGTQFKLDLIWRGPSTSWPDIHSLVLVWSHLGAMGFRSRRSMGAIRCISHKEEVSGALTRFSNGSSVSVVKVDGSSLNSWRDAAAESLKWYRSWRQHGQMNRRWDRRSNSWITISPAQQAENRSQPGFRYARRDHNEGLAVQGTGAPSPDPEAPHGLAGQTFRPALGLPIIQFFSSLGGPNGPIPKGRATVNWNETPDGGRFASPVLLRPHKDVQGRWHALVIFVDALAWPVGKQVYLNRQPRQVSLDLYNAMKADKRLTSFP